MRLFTVQTLSPSQKNALASLVSRCQDAEGLSLSFPFEEGSLFLFLEEKNNVWAAMAFTPLWEDAFECAAFTDPSRRREGLFSRLLRAGLSALPGECDVYF